MALQIAMMASKRARPYAQESLRSMFERDDIDVPVRVMACNSDPSFLGEWVDDERVQVEKLSDAEWLGAYANYNVCRKISETFLRCLIPATEAGDDLVLLQDDVMFSWDWLKTTRALFAEARGRLLLKFQDPERPVVLSLFSPGKHLGRDTPLAPYKMQCFYANIGLFFSANCLPGLVELTRRSLGEMDDMIVKDFLLRGGASLFAVNPSIIQHTGNVSTHGCTDVRSPTFKEYAHTKRRK